MGAFIGLVITGAIFGALARLFMKGSQPIGVLWTIVLGALGALAGGWVTDALFGGSTLVMWIVGILLAILFISIYLSLTGKRSRTA